MNDRAFMDMALSLAHSAGRLGEVPVGAIIVKDGVVVATGMNLRETTLNPCAHAELLAIEGAARRLQSWRLTDCDLYVTLEPCLMCSGAIYQARMRHVFFGALDPKGGAMGSLYRVHEDVRLNHRLAVTGGISGEACGKVLSEFFQSRRKSKSPTD